MFNFYLPFITAVLSLKLCMALTWQSIPHNLPAPMNDLCVIVTNEEIVYAFGGRIYNNPQQKSWKYDSLNGWRDIAVTLPINNMFCTYESRGVVTENNIAYFFGVYNSDPGTIYAFDINTESFITHNIPSPPIPIYGCSTLMDKDNTFIFLLGGGQNVMQILDLNKNEWIENITSNPNNVHRYGGVGLYFDSNSQNLFTFGGFDGSSFFNSVWKYSMINNDWIMLSGTLSESKYRVQSILANDGNVYIFGGYIGGYNVKTKVDAFNVNDWSVTPQTALPEARASVVSAYIDNKVMYWGGYGNINGNTALWNGLTWYQTGYMTEELMPSSTCEEDGEIKHINWNDLQNSVDNSAEIPYSNFSISLDSTRLELIFDIDLEYIGNSSDGNFDFEYNLGTTYVIDFESFGTEGNVINEPGKCQNRLSSSFLGIADFRNYWYYSEYPYLSNEIGSNTYLSYPPPSEYWTLSINDFTCSPINYFGIFSWNDLSECTDFNGNNLISIYSYTNNITLSGTLYVNLVSPYSMSPTDNGIYRTFPLIQQDFSISIIKQINVLSSTGIDLFISSIIGIYQDSINKKYEISLLTQSADYIELTSPNIVLTPFGGSSTASITSVTSSCLVASSFTCGQIFTITIDALITCPPADLTGTYDMLFTVTCPGGEAVCTTFFDDNDGSAIGLSVDSNFIDNTCDPQIFNIIFDGNMEFYDDSDFSTVHDDGNGNYVIGQDPIYVQIDVNFNDDGNGNNYNIFAVQIDNVFVCTADDGVDLTLNLDQENGAGGCLSSNIDADGPYNIIINGVVNSYYSATIISNGDITSNIAQFSFLTFDIGRTTMYIHTQLTLILQNGSRRRLLLSSSQTNSNQIRHFIDSTTVISQSFTTSNNVDYDSAQQSKAWYGTVEYLIISVLAILAVFGCIAILIYRYYHQYLAKQKQDVNTSISCVQSPPISTRV